MATGYAQSFDDVPKEKTAILMVHFGTTFDDTRALTIDAINEKALEQFPGITVVEAYTSRIIISRLKKRGIFKQTPKEALLRLAADGYTHTPLAQPRIISLSRRRGQTAWMQKKTSWITIWTIFL